MVCFALINSIRQYLTESAAKTIIQMMVVSRLDYCNSLYNGLPMKSIKKLCTGCVAEYKNNYNEDSCVV